MQNSPVSGSERTEIALRPIGREGLPPLRAGASDVRFCCSCLVSGGLLLMGRLSGEIACQRGGAAKVP